MRKILAISLLLFALPTVAQDEIKKDSLWNLGGETSLLFSQVSLSNWAAGGENSLAASSFLNLFANYKHDKIIWDTKLEMSFGLQKQGEQSLRKSDDKLYITSTVGKELSKNWYLTASLGFKSQFAKGYNYPNELDVISKFLAPGYITLATGLQYKPNDSFIFNVSPIAGKLTLVNDQMLADAGAFGVKPGSKSTMELGTAVTFNLKTEIIENVELKSNLEFYSAYTNNPEYIDVNWEVFINLKVNKYITTTLTTHLIYDHDILIANAENVLASRVQFKELFGLGISYKF